MVAKRDQRSFMQRWLPHPLLSVALILLWMLLLNSFTAGGLLVGAVLSLVISAVTSNFWPARPPLRSWPRALEFMLLVLWDVAVANVQVARLILFCPASTLRSRWITIPLSLTSPEAITVLAGTITMTPGTVSGDVAADGRSLLVHCLDAPDAEAAVRDITARYQTRLMEIF